MTEYVLPPNVLPTSVDWKLADFSGDGESPTAGSLNTISRGQRWQVVVTYRNLSKSDRATMQAFASAMRGKANRAWLWDPAYIQRGSFPGVELFTNPTFANGTTGWNVGGTAGAMTASDGTMRLTATGAGAQIVLRQSVNSTAYMPHIVRGLLADGNGSAGLSAGPVVQDATAAFTNYSTARGLVSATGVMPLGGAGNNAPLVVSSTSGYVAGMYFLVPYSSMQRCAHVDNGPNLILQSNSFTTTWTTTNATLTSGIAGAPDGTATAWNLVENTTSSGHQVQQSITVGSGAADYAFSCYVAAGTRTWAWMQIKEQTGSTTATAYINLSTGALGTVAVGANWANIRAFVVNYGGGYYRLTIVARKTNAATTLVCIVGAATGDLGSNYAGVASAIAINIWHASLSQSSLPVQDTVTTTAASTGVTQTGTLIDLRGLPASTSRLLALGDRFDINGEIKIATADLNSDASGLGSIQFEPALRTTTLADGAPVVIGDPLGRFAMITEMDFSSQPGFFSDLELTFQEA